MRTLWTVMALGWLAACSGDGKEETETSDATSSGDCSDPSFNPWSGTCVETYLVDCFDPAGECEVSFTKTGSSTVEWENGATVASSTTIAGTSVATATDIISSDGSLCATGVTTIMDGDCDARTEYTRSSDGAVMVYCSYQDGSMDVTCADGSTLSVTAAQSQGASSCQYGSEAGACSL